MRPTKAAKAVTAGQHFQQAATVVLRVCDKATEFTVATLKNIPAFGRTSSTTTLYKITGLERFSQHLHNCLKHDACECFVIFSMCQFSMLSYSFLN